VHSQRQHLPARAHAQAQCTHAHNSTSALAIQPKKQHNTHYRARVAHRTRDVRATRATTTSGLRRYSTQHTHVKAQTTRNRIEELKVPYLKLKYTRGLARPHNNTSHRISKRLKEKRKKMAHMPMPGIVSVLHSTSAFDTMCWISDDLMGNDRGCKACAFVYLTRALL